MVNFHIIHIPDVPAKFGCDPSINRGVDAERTNRQTNGRTNPNYSMILVKSLNIELECGVEY